MSDSLKQKTISGVIWGFFEKFSVQLFSFVQGVILARLLMPADFGLIAMAGVFNAISKTLIDSGFSNALVRKIDRNDLDFSTVFDINVVMSIIMASLLCLFSKAIANFYNEPLLSTIVCLNALRLFLGSLTAVQATRLYANMQFKTISKIRIFNSFFGGIISIIMAFMGFGVWSLVYPNFFTIASGAALYWYYQRWFPGINFSKKSFNELFGFGSKLLISNLINVIYGNIYPIVIGKKFSSTDLAFFSKGRSYPSIPASTVTDVVGSVAYPILSNIQDDQERLAAAYTRMIRMSAFLLFPIMIGLSALARPFIITLITSKWEPCVIYLQIICFSMMWYPIHALNLQLLKVIGRSDLFLRLEIIKKILGITILCVTLPFGILYLCIGSVVSSVISLFINTYYTGKFINMGFWAQMKQLYPSLILSMTMGVVVYLSTMISDNNIIKLVVGIPIGLFFYFIISILFQSKDLTYLKEIIKAKFLKR